MEWVCVSVCVSEWMKWMWMNVSVCEWVSEWVPSFSALVVYHLICSHRLLFLFLLISFCLDVFFFSYWFTPWTKTLYSHHCWLTLEHSHHWLTLEHSHHWHFHLVFTHIVISQLHIHTDRHTHTHIHTYKYKLMINLNLFFFLFLLDI